MHDLSGVKVGDKLCIYGRLSRDRIAIVDRLTPTGRVITKAGTFSVHGRMYGRLQDSWNQQYARPATEDDIAGIYRAGLVSKIERFRGWDKLSADDLESVAALVVRYEVRSLINPG
jgi:hypothetical protein